MVVRSISAGLSPNDPPEPMLMFLSKLFEECHSGNPEDVARLIDMIGRYNTLPILNPFHSDTSELDRALARLSPQDVTEIDTSIAGPDVSKKTRKDIIWHVWTLVLISTSGQRRVRAEQLLIPGKMNNETVKSKIHIIPSVVYRWSLQSTSF